MTKEPYQELSEHLKALQKEQTEQRISITELSTCVKQFIEQSNKNMIKQDQMWDNHLKLFSDNHWLKLVFYGVMVAFITIFSTYGKFVYDRLTDINTQIVTTTHITDDKINNVQDQLDVLKSKLK